MCAEQSVRVTRPAPPCGAIVTKGETMGDKGGKKDKAKSKQQQSKRQDQQAREKQAKARPQTSSK